MNKVFVSFPLTGFSEADKRIADRIVEQIESEYLDIHVVGTSNMNNVVEITPKNEKIVDYNTNLILLKELPIDEVWLYGDHVNDLMSMEINMAYAMKIPIVPKTEEMKNIYSEMNFIEKKSKSKLWWWVGIGIAWIVLAIIIFFLLQNKGNS